MTRVSNIPICTTKDGLVWILCANDFLFVGKYNETYDKLGRKVTSHVAMFEDLVANRFSSDVVAAGSIKADGSLSGNSAFNNPGVVNMAKTYKGMNGPIDKSTKVPWEVERDLAVARHHDLHCSAGHLEKAMQLYVSGKFTKINYP